MTDRELVIRAATDVMGWRGEQMGGPQADADYGLFFRRADGRYAGLTAWGPASTVPGTIEGWNPLMRDADAFMLVDALKDRWHAAFVLGSNGCSNQWTAWIFEGVWALAKNQNQVPEHGDSHLLGCASAGDRRRAIVLASLCAVGVPA
jgi:hypothetical protein